MGPMATIDPVEIKQPTGAQYDGISVYQWTLAAGDTATPLSLPNNLERSIQIDANPSGGAWGGATVAIKGTLDPSLPFQTLHDHTGVGLTASAAKIDYVAEAARLIRPEISGGDVTTSIVVLILLKR